MERDLRLNPKGYEGTGRTSHRLGEIIPNVVAKISAKHQDRGDLIMATWPTIVGPQYAPITKASSFVSGTLLVKVRSSSALSVLVTHMHGKLLRELQKRFPYSKIEKIVFKIG